MTGHALRTMRSCVVLIIHTIRKRAQIWKGAITGKSCGRLSCTEGSMLSILVRMCKKVSLSGLISGENLVRPDV